MPLLTRRRAVQPSVRAKADTKTFPAPIRGLVTNESVAKPKPMGARVLENFFPQTDSLRVRSGRSLYATVHASDSVEALMVYQSATGSKLFAATGTKIFNISSPATPTTIPSADVSSLNSGDYSHVSFATAGGQFMVAVNGADKLQLYDGAAWTAVDGVSTPAITGATTSDFSHVWVYQSRLFFVKKNSLNAYYMPVDSIGGAASTHSLLGVMQKGGALLFGCSFSMDSGNGPNNYCVFVSDQGEVAAYQGANPATWSLIGVYEIGKPLHKNAIMRAGGDIIVVTKQGFVPLSAAMAKDPGVMELSAVSYPIQPTWQYLTARSPGRWAVGKWVEGNMAVIGYPADASGVSKALVVNLQTGAWTVYTNWSVNCAAELGGVLYIANTAGQIFTAETGGSDNGEPYFCTYVGSHEPIDSSFTEKAARMARTTWSYGTDFNYRISVSSNYDTTAMNYPEAAVVTGGDVWDSGLWDTARWSGADDMRMIQTAWRGVSGHGFSISPVVQVTVGSTAAPKASLLSFDLVFERGAIVT